MEKLHAQIQQSYLNSKPNGMLSLLFIWCRDGINRPYSVPENVTAKNGSKEYFYIRSGTSSIIAKGEVLDELRELASRVPFDERGNPDIRLEDISTLLLREYR